MNTSSKFGVQVPTVNAFHLLQEGHIKNGALFVYLRKQDSAGRLGRLGWNLDGFGLLSSTASTATACVCQETGKKIYYTAYGAPHTY